MKPRAYRFGGSRTAIFGLLALLIAGCATLPPAQPAADLKQIVGKWEGTLRTSGGASLPMTTTINPDGTYESVIPALSNPGPRFPGQVTVSEGRFRWKSHATGRTGTYTLHEGEGRRLLVSVADDRSSTSEVTPVK